MKRFRWGICTLLLSLFAALPAQAQDEVSDSESWWQSDSWDEPTPAMEGRPWYFSSMFSYTYADKDRGLEDPIGAVFSVGKKVTSGMTLEITGYGSWGDGHNPNYSTSFAGIGIGSMFFPTSSPNFYGVMALMYNRTEDHPGAIANYDSTVFDVGAGYLFPLSRYISIRAEARYRTDQHDRKEAGATPGGKAFSDGVFNVGLFFPLGVTPDEEEDDGAQVVDLDSMDSDNDGVPDSIDQCPDTPAGAIVDETGCENDADGDGVVDRLDQCPDTPAGTVVNAQGCAVDSDGDGVPDDIDECPNTPAGAKVLQNGCALLDDCRMPRPGEQVDENGCAVEQAFILRGVKFEFDSDRLTPPAREILNGVAETLKGYPNIDVELEGHTDYIGTEAYNIGLSERRANAVKAYLSDRGVERDRMYPVGYGKSRPIADNNTEAGREENRRVELRVVE